MTITSLFQKTGDTRPLAERLRPQHIHHVVGQQHLLGEGKPLTKFLAAHRLPSLILWGPPGCGKTTLAHLLARQVGLHFQALSALVNGVSDLRKAFDEAEERRLLGIQTLLFIDEIHRFSRSQQDIFLLPVEKGIITLVGATTENPSFELNSALLSRCRVLVLESLSISELDELLKRSEELENQSLPLTEDARTLLLHMADGDGRTILNFAETLFLYASGDLIDSLQLVDTLQKRAPLYDKNKDSHYSLISALHKSIRGSDPQAALYWFARMIDAGEDPLYIARRLMRTACEDVGLAVPQALQQVVAAQQTYQMLGSPEGVLALAQAVVYLAILPKSNAIYVAYKKARQAAQSYGSLPPPKHILNAPTKLMESLDYGKGYQYDHDLENAFSGQNYFPEKMKPMTFYKPTVRGQEANIAKHLSELNSLKKK